MLSEHSVFTISVPAARTSWDSSLISLHDPASAGKGKTVIAAAASPISVFISCTDAQRV